MQSSAKSLFSSALSGVSPRRCRSLVALANLSIARVFPQLLVISRYLLRVPPRHPGGCPCSLLLCLLLLLLLPVIVVTGRKTDL